MPYWSAGAGDGRRVAAGGLQHSRIFTTLPAPLFTPTELIATAVKRPHGLDLRGGGLVMVSFRHAIGG